MVKLIIAGMQVNLSADISFEYYDRNPLFSKEGKHTLDIDIDLADPQNAYVYSSLQRIDVMAKPVNRTAVLINERGVILRGTEVLLEIDEKKAKIQLVAGNSELNYLSGGDKKIADLDLGSIEGLNETVAWNSLSGSYPTWDYVCTPVCVKAAYRDEQMPYIWTPNSVIMNEVIRQNNSIGLKSGTTLCPQPYLPAMVKKVITALGYTIGSNFLDTNAVMKKVILINGYHSTDFNQMVPNWDVNTFISEVEKFTGCIFVVNQITKVVDIIQANYFYQNMEEEVIAARDIIGEVNKKFNEEAPEGVLYHNVSYKFPQTEIYNYWSVANDIMDSLTVKPCELVSLEDSRGYNFLLDIWSELNGGTLPQEVIDVPESIVNEYNKMICYEDLGRDWGFNFVLRCTTRGYSHLRQINKYGPHIDPNSEDTMELSIVPVELVWGYPAMLDDGEMWQLPVPLARNSDYKGTETTEDEETLGLNEYIAGEKEEEKTSETMYAAFYLGFRNCNFTRLGNPRTIVFNTPVAAPSNIMERFKGAWMNRAFAFWENQEMIDFNADGYDMSINGSSGMYNQFWRNNLKVDFTRPYVIRFRNVKTRDSRNIFIIANKKFYCSELKYIGNGKEISEIVEGTFYSASNAEEDGTVETFTATAVHYVYTGQVDITWNKKLTRDINIGLGAGSYTLLLTMAAGTRSISVTRSQFIEQILVAEVYQESDDYNTYNISIVSNNTRNVKVELSYTSNTITASLESELDEDVFVYMILGTSESGDADLETTLTIPAGETEASMAAPITMPPTYGMHAEAASPSGNNRFFVVIMNTYTGTITHHTDTGLVEIEFTQLLEKNINISVNAGSYTYILTMVAGSKSASVTREQFIGTTVTADVTKAADDDNNYELTVVPVSGESNAEPS